MVMKVQVSSIWKKKTDTKDSRIQTHDPDSPVYYANHYTTEDLLDGTEIIYVHIYSMNPNPKKEPNHFRNRLISKGSA